MVAPWADSSASAVVGVGHPRDGEHQIVLGQKVGAGAEKAGRRRSITRLRQSALGLDRQIRVVVPAEPLGDEGVPRARNRTRSAPTIRRRSRTP